MKCSAVVAPHEAVGFHQSHQECRSSGHNRVAGHFGAGKRGEKQREQEENPAEHAENVERWHDHAFEVVAFGSPRDALPSVVESAIPGPVALFGMKHPQITATHAAEHRWVKPAVIRHGLSACMFYRWAENGQ